MKYLIIGGVAGGASTAARLRRNDEHAEIVMFEKGDYISYANCGLPYYIGGVIEDRENLFVQTPEKFFNTLKVEVRINNEVVKIDRDNKEVIVKDLKENKEYRESYDKLVLSPGAEPIRPPIPGIDSDKIFTLRNVPDTDKIKEYIDTKKPSRAVIVGAGFIGLEMAENLKHMGIFVTIVEMADQVMNLLDYEMAAEVHQHLKTKNVEFYLKDGVSSFKDEDGKVNIKLNSGREIAADIVILSIGVKPESHLAKDSGLKVGERGGIIVDEYMRTSDHDIYALGDAIEVINPASGMSGVVPLAGPANKQGRIVANNIAFGDKVKYPGTIGTGIAKVFDLTVASTGLSEKLLKRTNIPYKTVITHTSSHAGYYPGAIPLSIKTIFSSETGKLLGGQIVGYEGIDKRIDLMAAIIKKEGSIFDLGEIEHAYAPPYSSAKDPVNIAGFVAENVYLGKSRHIQWDELLKLDKKDIFLLDVRTPEEFALDTIEGAVNISNLEIRNRLDEIPKNKKIIIFCGVGLRGYLAERILLQNGFKDVYNLSGGFKTYSIATQKQDNSDIFENDYIDVDDNIYQNTSSQDADKKVFKVDACGLQCPGPILKLKNEMEKLNPGEQIMEIASDPGFAKDVKAWASMTGNKVLSVDIEGGKVTAVIEKSLVNSSAGRSNGVSNSSSLVVFSDDMDKALASFVIANGAASAGKEVTMFFTFWGLNVIKKAKKQKVKKDFMGKMFSMMLPSNSRKLKLSKLNMGGMGAVMMKSRMKSKKVDSLETMLQTALHSGVKMVACQMSMDIMGVKKEELIDGIEVGGVATYLEAAGKSAPNLFI